MRADPLSASVSLTVVIMKPILRALRLPFDSPLFERRQAEAASILGIAPCTLQHACQQLGIGRWPWLQLRTDQGTAGTDPGAVCTVSASGGPDGAAAEIAAAAGSVAPPSESMLLGDHGRRWQRQNVKHGGLLDEALDLL